MTSNPSRKNEALDGIEFHETLAAQWTEGYKRGSFNFRRSSFVPITERNVSANQVWLDLGCGSGVLSTLLLDQGASVFAVDGSPRMLEEAKTNLPPAHSKSITWLCSDVQALTQLDDGFFDGVLCSSVIEYVDQPPAMLKEICRVMRSGGKLILSVPPKRSAVRVAQKLIRRVARAVGREKYPYLSVSRFEVSSKSVGSWLGDYEFELTRVTDFDPLLPKFLMPPLVPALKILEAYKR